MSDKNSLSKNFAWSLFIGCVLVAAPITFLATPTTTDDDTPSAERLSLVHHSNGHSHFLTQGGGFFGDHLHTQTLLWWSSVSATFLIVSFVFYVNATGRAPPLFLQRISIT